MSDNQNPYNNPYGYDPNQGNPYAADPGQNPYGYDPNQYGSYQTDPNQYGNVSQPGMTYQDPSLAELNAQAGQAGQSAEPTYTSYSGGGNPYDGSMNYVTGQVNPNQNYAGGSNPYAGGADPFAARDAYRTNTVMNQGSKGGGYVQGEPLGNSALGICSLVFSILGCTAFFGLIMGLIDVVQKNGRKKGCAIAGIIISLLWIIGSVLITVFSGQISDKLVKQIEKQYGYGITTQHSTEATTESYDTTEEFSFDYSNDSDEDAPDSSDDRVEVNTAGFDAQTVAENLNITTYTKIGEYYNQYFILIENTSSYWLDFDVSVKYYDDDDKLIGTDDSSTYAIDCGNKALFIFYPDEGFTKAEYTVVPKVDEYFIPATDAIDYDISENPDKLVVTVKNTSDKDLDNVEARAIFFKGDEVVGADVNYFMGSDYNLKAGEEVSKELCCYEEFDRYEIYIYPRKANY
ncbi:MAG: hypothetical protein J5517_01355 [Eubacterium sp.]|nr:hypothetical protein [Eubacterium sp.]